MHGVFDEATPLDQIRGACD